MALLLIISSLLAPPPVSNEFAALFKAEEYRYTGGRYENELFRYRLFVPRRLEPNKQYPLIVWLHGHGERGSNNKEQLLHLDRIFDRETPEKYRFFMLVVQCTEANGCWYQGGTDQASQSDDMITVAMEILDKTMRERPVDPDRVYLSGVSSGGNGCWEAAMRYPELFAAVAPMSSGGGDESRAERLADIPIWAFHSRDDTCTPPEGVQRMVQAVKEAGGKVHLTLVPTSMHNSLPAAQGDHQIVEWLLSQRRTSILWTPPGSSPDWQWWQVFGVPLALGVLICLGWLSEVRRRRRIRAKEADPETIPES